MTAADLLREKKRNESREVLEHVDVERSFQCSQWCELGKQLSATFAL